MVRQCLLCQKEFITYPSKILLGRGKYCSKSCADTKTLFQKGRIGNATKTSFQKGVKHPRYKGWRYCGRHHKYKMILMPGHPMADPRGYIREHRYIMSQKLGRLLERSEEVHHIDGNGLNNNPDNLMLISSKSEHLRLEHKKGTYKTAYIAMAKSHGNN